VPELRVDLRRRGLRVPRHLLHQERPSTPARSPAWVSSGNYVDRMTETMFTQTMTTCQKPNCHRTDTTKVTVNDRGGYQLFCPEHALVAAIEHLVADR
jgi:transposase InsO family protein